MKLTFADFDRLFDGLKSEAFRAEVLPEYNIPDEQESLERWRRGGPISEFETDSPWQRRVREWTSRGVSVSRVRVINGTPTEYQRQGFDWWYPSNEVAGERTFILDASTSSVEVPTQDFWILDGAVLLMDYDIEYRFVCASMAPDEDYPRYAKFKDEMLAAAVPFREFLPSLA